MVSEFYPHYTKIAISWYQMGLRKKHNGFAAFGFFKPGQVWWCPISCEESHQPGITYAIYYTFAILCFDVLVLIFVGRSWRSSGSQDWPFRCRHGRPGWLRAAKLEVFDLPRGGITLRERITFITSQLRTPERTGRWTQIACGFQDSGDRSLPSHYHLQPRGSREEISQALECFLSISSGVVNPSFPLLPFFSHQYPSMINDVGKQPTKISHQLKPFFSHSSAIGPQVGWMSGWHSFILLGISLQG